MRSELVIASKFELMFLTCLWICLEKRLSSTSDVKAAHVSSVVFIVFKNQSFAPFRSSRLSACRYVSDKESQQVKWCGYDSVVWICDGPRSFTKNTKNNSSGSLDQETCIIKVLSSSLVSAELLFLSFTHAYG